ncbi:hypothetical protein FRB94_011809 [Tulasnella sp. JGI-2019a]|nr:hypothetical protein FRB93_002257 [Tulasnella sp. JGI-2019a]KAG9014631.1 hypothetical protein FRB94_011809 [Tulasnella sp. JGI-2019a]
MDNWNAAGTSNAATQPPLALPSPAASTASGPTRMSSRPRIPSLAGREPQTLADMAKARSDLTTSPVDYSYNSPNERTTRSKTVQSQKPKLASKVKLKLGEKATQGIGTSFLGAYDRELDTEDEEDADLVFEEQFILKMPEGEDCDRLRGMVQARAIGSDVWFKQDGRRGGVFHIGNSTYTTKLVDLPCIIESHKTLDNKQLFKVADICQALVLGERRDDDDPAPSNKPQPAFSKEDVLWPHGITPPLKWVRKRRFRKRIDKASIEVVEQQLERLAEADARAEQVGYTVLENVNPDLSDSEFDIDRAKAIDDEFFDENENINNPSPEAGGATPGGGHLDDGMGDEAEADGGDDDDEDDLAAELERALAGEEESGEDDEDEEDEEDETEDEMDEDEDAELTQARRLLEDEIQDLEAAVEKKVTEIARAGNPLIKRRFEDALKKLKGDLEAKRTQIEALTSKSQEDDALEADGLEDDNEDLFADDDDDDDDEGPDPATLAGSKDGNGGDQGDGVTGTELGPLTAPDGAVAVAPPPGPMVIQLGSS